MLIIIILADFNPKEAQKFVKNPYYEIIKRHKYIQLNVFF